MSGADDDSGAEARIPEHAPDPTASSGYRPPPSLAPRYTLSTYRPRYRWPARPAGGARNPVVQWSAAIVCSVVIIVCLSVCGVYIARLPEVAHDVADSLAVIFIAGGIGLIAGVVPLYYLARASRAWRTRRFR